MGFLSKLFGSKKNDGKTKPIEKNTVPQVSEHFLALERDNKDCTDGFKFSATCQVRTPLDVLLKHGEVYRGVSTPPTYGRGAQDGIWIINVLDKYRYEDSGKSSSDAGSVSSGDYIKFAIGLRTIFESKLKLNEKMQKIISYADDLDDDLKYIAKALIHNRGGSRGQREDDLADVMAVHLSTDDRKKWYFDKKNHLTIVNGVNKKIMASLENNGFSTMQEISNLELSELITLDGIGKVSAKKILDDCLYIKKLWSSSLLK